MTFNTYSIKFKLYKSPKIPPKKKPSSNLVHFNYKCDLVATKLLTRGWKIKKHNLHKSRKCIQYFKYKLNLVVTKLLTTKRKN